MRTQNRSRSVTLSLLLTLFTLLALPYVGHAATFTVNSLLDKAGLQANCVSGAGECTLRSAIQAANASVAADTIVLPVGTYTLTIAGANENAAATGDLDITGLGGVLTITGAGATTTVIDGNGAATGDRVFELVANASLAISGVTVRGGNPGAAGTGGAFNTAGGTTLSLTNVILANNSAGAEGGAIAVGANRATLTMDTVAVVGNVSAGGALNLGATSVMTVTNSTISGNNDTAINNSGTVNLTNVTLSGNTTTGNGAAIDNKAAATVNLVNVTISGNSAPLPANAGGIRNLGTVTIKNSIIANNAPNNCGATVLTSQGNNLTNVAGCGLTLATDKVAAAPLLGVLANNGGAVQTVALLPGSPAIDAAAAVGCPATDARGIVRPVAGAPPSPAACDIGAFEFRPQQIVVALAPPFDFGAVTDGTTVDHTITLANAGDGALIIGTLAAADPLAAPFSIALDNCSGVTLPLGGTCTATTRFAPTAVGAIADSFSIPSNDPLTPAVSFALTGIGTAAPVAVISVTDTIAPANDNLLPFGSVQVGGSADASITVTNAGTANLVLGQIASAAPLAAPFTIIANTCSGATIAPTASCALTVRFTPVDSATSSGSFDIPSNLPVVAVTVSGTGITPATATTGTGTTPPGTTPVTPVPGSTPTVGTANNPPLNPVLFFPANNQLSMPTSVTFIWNKTTDPDGDPVTYHLMYSTDIGFAVEQTKTVDLAAVPVSGALLAGFGSMGGGFLLFGLVSGRGMRGARRWLYLVPILLLSGALFTACGGGGSSSTQQNTSPDTGAPQTPTPTAAQLTATVNGLAANTTYYWKVVADDGKGLVASSETFTFKTQ
jgi:CSLREA domain-containing protein